MNTLNLILSDINMPGHDGFFVLNKVRRQWPSIPVVLMSGTPVAREASAAGADGFILKPFSLQQFGATVTAAIKENLESQLQEHS
ncbi:response regulator [Nitrospira sp. Nam74]